jgi:hypothetical protein
MFFSIIFFAGISFYMFGKSYFLKIYVSYVLSSFIEWVAKCAKLHQIHHKNTLGSWRALATLVHEHADDHSVPQFLAFTCNVKTPDI